MNTQPKNLAVVPDNKDLAVMTDKELNDVLRNSLFPNASDMSLELVKGYCKATGLDIMLKPAHIVPMWNSAVGKMVDTVMPGIGLYRIIASRTGEYGGISEPEFGKIITQKFDNLEFSFPEWCKVTVRRQYKATGYTAEFTAKELWIENYTAKGGKEKSMFPNAMWQKRPFAQIAKCAEAQALRKAFPEVGQQPTAEEMEGKPLNNEIIINPRPDDLKPALPTCAELVERVKGMAEAELTPDKMRDWDLKPYTEAEIRTIKGEVTLRRKQLREAAVVATVPPAAPPGQAQADNDDAKWQSLIDNATCAEEVNAIFTSMPDDVMARFGDAVDLKLDALRGTNGQ